MADFKIEKSNRTIGGGFGLTKEKAEQSYKVTTYKTMTAKNGDTVEVIDKETYITETGKDKHIADLEKALAKAKEEKAELLKAKAL